MLTIAFLAPKTSNGGRFHTERTMCIILGAEILCYLAIRYINSKSEKKFLKKTGVASSIKRFFSTKRSRHLNASPAPKRPYLFSCFLILLMLGSMIAYSALQTSSTFLFEEASEGYLVSTIFWSAIALPFLF